MNLKINKIQHIGIPVTNMKNSITFYEGLGFSNVMIAQFEMNSEKGDVTMMQLDEIVIELYQMPNSELPAIKARKNGHIDHIAFDVDDIESCFLMMQKEGYAIQEPAPVFLQFWTKGCKYFNILGPDGERIEFNEILK